MMDYMRIAGQAEKIKQKIVEWRRTFHRHPEIALRTFETARTVVDVLKGLGIEANLVVDGAGVRGRIAGSKRGRTIALRADMDALPIQEASQAAYRSQVPGCMHACGHDAHTAMLLGAAMILSEMRESLPGDVVLLFQPAEETGEGAKRMVEEGVLEGVNSVFGLHVRSGFSSGAIGYRSGPFMAAGDFFDARIIGKGGHGGMPHHSVDPIPMAAQFISGLQSIVSRECDPLESAVVSVCSMEAGKGAYNVLPDSVDLRGTIRYHNPDLGPMLAKRVKSILQGITSAMRGSFEFTLTDRFPLTVNDEDMTALAASIAGEMLGKGRIFEMKPLMGSEDFAYYLQHVPGTLVFLGVENKEKGIIYPHHHPQFDVDEDALPVGTALHVAVAVEYLGQ